MTNQFFSYAGAELTVLELAEELVSRGWECVIKATVVGAPLSYRAFSGQIDVSAFSENVAVGDYDIVWCQHGTIANIDYYSLVQQAYRPFIISAHLSPYMALEKILHPYTSELADLVVANSVETAKSLPAWLKSEVVVNNNPAPQKFFRERNYRSAIENVLCISNHLPGELAHVLLHFERNLKINVSYIGIGAECRRVHPSDVIAADAVVSIGKSVQYALASRTPVYVYDHFGGDGWVTPHNICDQALYNFSGRPRTRRLTSGEIFEEISQNYAETVRTTAEISDAHLDKFRLSAFVDNIIMRSAQPRSVIDVSKIDSRVMEVVSTHIKLQQDALRERYRLPTSDIWSQPSLDSYFGRR